MVDHCCPRCDPGGVEQIGLAKFRDHELNGSADIAGPLEALLRGRAAIGGERPRQAHDVWCQAAEFGGDAMS